MTILRRSRDGVEKNLLSGRQKVDVESFASTVPAKIPGDKRDTEERFVFMGSAS